MEFLYSIKDHDTINLSSFTRTGTCSSALMYAHLFKVVKRKILSSEDIDILCKHGHVKSASGENLLHHYIRYNPCFDKDVANRLREACGFDSVLRDGETIMESVFYLDDHREEILQWLLDFPNAYNVRKNFVFEYLQENVYYEQRYHRMWKSHNLDKVIRQFS